MNKAILKSVFPKRCEQIASGKCTILLSKTKPKLKTPYKVYIYCTQQTSSNVLMVSIDGKQVIIEDYRNASLCDQYGCPNWNIGEGKVIGEFVCDKVEILDGATAETEKDTCLRMSDIYRYAKDKLLYSLHISQLKIYDTPKELGEFKRWNKSFKNDRLTCPPRSPCYVEELE